MPRATGFTVVELKAKLRAVGKLTTGKKAQLQARLNGDPEPELGIELDAQVPQRSGEAVATVEVGAFVRCAITASLMMPATDGYCDGVVTAITDEAGDASTPTVTIAFPNA